MTKRWKYPAGSSLQLRLLYFVALGTLLSLAILGTLGYLAVRQAVGRSLEERRVLARFAATHLESVLEKNVQYLSNFSRPYFDLENGDLALERQALRDLYFQSIFDSQVYLLDPQGALLLAEPGEAGQGKEDFASMPFFQQARREGRWTISTVYYLEPGQRPVISVIAPLRNRAGTVAGWVGGSIDLTGPGLTRLMEPADLAKTGYVEVVDNTGIVLASTRPELLLTSSDHGQILANLITMKEDTVRTCHSCHASAGTNLRETEVMAFVPLTTVPWGVGIRQSEAEALAPVRSLQQRFILFGGLLLALNLAMAYAISRGVLRPIRTLTRTSERLARGDLKEPVPPLGKDEVGVLGSTLETMRQKLLTSMETIQEWNKVLEARITERTQRLERAQQDREQLIQRLISAQEEERRRVARELHDEVGQNIASLAMALDRTSGGNAGRNDNSGPFAEAKALALRTMDEIHRISLDLRPSILDDLGLVAALRWYSENRLERWGVKVHLDLPDEERRLPPATEVALFRVAQEAISNIARHSEAKNATITLEFTDGVAEMNLEDDGKGFNVAEVMGPEKSAAGLGILGMSERVSLLGGAMTVDSAPGKGTVVSVRVPLPAHEQSNG